MSGKPCAKTSSLTWRAGLDGFSLGLELVIHVFKGFMVESVGLTLWLWGSVLRALWRM